MKPAHIVALLILPIIAASNADAQTNVHHIHKKAKKHKLLKEQPKMSAEEKKKAAVQRTLKEKGFHLPDTLHRK